MLTTEQKQIYEEIKTSSKRLFLITGEAGTGKSYLLSHIVEGLSPTHTILTTATTNKAKNNLIEVLGRTCYTTQSALGFILHTDYMYSILRDTNEAKTADILIIDEISMLQPEVLNKALNEPFKKIVMVGDFSQLPPIGQAIDFSTLECERFTLTQQLRQQDKTLTKIFSNLRNHISKKCLLSLNELEHESITLYKSHKEFCEAFIEAKQTKHILAYTNRVVDSYNYNLNNNKRFSVGDTLILDKRIGKFSNGDKVYVTSCLELAEYFELQLNDIQTIRVYKTKQKEDEVLLGCFNGNYPPSLQNIICRPKHLFALTIHKAQGMTIDNVFIDVKDLYSQLTKRTTRFSPSPPLKVHEYLRLLYVGLSRMKLTGHLFIGKEREYKHLRRPNVEKS